MKISKIVNLLTFIISFIFALLTPLEINGLVRVSPIVYYGYITVPLLFIAICHMTINFILEWKNERKLKNKIMKKWCKCVYCKEEVKPTMNRKQFAIFYVLEMLVVTFMVGIIYICICKKTTCPFCGHDVKTGRYLGNNSSTSTQAITKTKSLDENKVKYR